MQRQHFLLGYFKTLSDDPAGAEVTHDLPHGSPMLNQPSHRCATKHEHVFNARKTKRIAALVGVEPRRCEDIKGIVAPEIGAKSFGTFEKQASDPEYTTPCNQVVSL